MSVGCIHAAWGAGGYGVLVLVGVGYGVHTCKKMWDKCGCGVQVRSGCIHGWEVGEYMGLQVDRSSGYDIHVYGGYLWMRVLMVERIVEQVEMGCSWILGTYAQQRT